MDYDLRRGRYPPIVDAKDDVTDRETFATDEQFEAAQIIADEWGRNTTFVSLDAEHGYDRSVFQKVYYRHFGVPESPLTFDDIKREYGSFSEFMQEWNRGAVAPEHVAPEYRDAVDIGGEKPVTHSDIVSEIGLDPDNYEDRDLRLIRIGYELAMASIDRSETSADE